MQFEREISTELLKWKNKTSRKPLILHGARQVGKTYLLKKFGATYFSDMAYFNFEEQPDLKQFFEETKSVERIIKNLSLVHGKEIKPGSTLIILDEIQECNPALNSLKYFCENAPEYVIVSAGSLLGISLSQESSFPVGKVEFIQIYPLGFDEFLNEADAPLANYVKQVEKISPIPDIFFNALLEKFRNYFISGGLPGAASILLETLNVEETQKYLKDLLQAYQFDFSKHMPARDIARISHVWKSIPAQLAKENKKFLYHLLKTGARAREYEDALLWLEQAGLVNKIHLCKKPHFPLSAYDDLSAFKLYLFDVGLLRSLAHLDAHLFSEKNRLFTEFKGAFSENYILQSLLIQFPVQPRYWASEGKAEVDFLIQYKNLVLPCEVKADENIRSKSLAVYTQKYQPLLRIRYSLKNLSFNEGLLNIPLFMADQTRKFIDSII